MQLIKIKRTIFNSKGKRVYYVNFNFSVNKNIHLKKLIQGYSIKTEIDPIHFLKKVLPELETNFRVVEVSNKNDLLI